MIDLSGTQRFIEVGWFRITVANLVVIVLMVVVFAAAVFAPFPAGEPAEPDLEPPADEEEPSGGWTGTARRWLRREFPLSRLLPSSEPAYVASWTYTFGVATLSALAVIIGTGIVLAIFGPGWRHASSFGRFVDAAHLWSVQVFFFFLVLHVVAQLLQATWRGGRGSTWVVGAVAMFGSFLTALTGYVSQQNFEAQWIATEAKDGVNAVGMGGVFNLMNTGQALTLHVLLLPLTVTLVVAVHIVLVRRRGVCPPIEQAPPDADIEREEVTA